MTGDTTRTGSRSLPLILARELAANLATPILIDAGGTLAFYNEAAELMLGKTYAEIGVITANEFGSMLEMADLDGTHLRRRDSPAGVAFYQREPAHRTLLVRPWTAPDGNSRSRPIPCLAISGTCTVCSPCSGRRSRESPGVRMPLLAGGTWSRDRQVRRQHVVYRGAGHERRRPGARRRHWHAPARCGHCRERHRAGPRAAQPSPPRPHSRPRLLPTTLPADVEVHLWGPSSPVQTLADRIATYLSPPLFPVRLADIPARLIFHDALRSS